MNFCRVFINFFVFLFVFGCNSVIFRCLNFCVFVYFVNFLFWKGGLLFDLYFFVILNIEKILLSFGIIVIVEVVFISFIIGYYE